MKLSALRTIFGLEIYERFRSKIQALCLPSRQIQNAKPNLQKGMASGQLDGADFVTASRDYAELEPVAKAAEAVAAMRGELAELTAITDPDPDMRAMAADEIERLAMLVGEVPTQQDVEIALVPRGDLTEALALEVFYILRRAGVGAELAYRGSPKNRFEKAKKAMIPRLLDVGSSDGEIGVLLIRDINVAESSPEPVRKKIKDALSQHFVITDPNPEFPRSIHLVRRK